MLKHGKETHVGISHGTVNQSRFTLVRFQGKSTRTVVAEGPNPAWNQQLKLNFVSPNNDYSADTLGRVKDEVRLTIIALFFETDTLI